MSAKMNKTKIQAIDKIVRSLADLKKRFTYDKRCDVDELLELSLAKQIEMHELYGEHITDEEADEREWEQYTNKGIS